MFFLFYVKIKLSLTREISQYIVFSSILLSMVFKHCEFASFFIFLHLYPGESSSVGPLNKSFRFKTVLMSSHGFTKHLRELIAN